jgi:ABC-type Fe3+/spermidine/putrescine transport system ATPase subunit
MLNDICFSLEQGEILALLGPSGSGKTTLLRLLAGLEAPDRGRIIFAGEDIAGTPPYKRSFGMMFQEYALFPHKDVLGNVAFGLETQGMAAADCRRKTEEILKMVDLNGYEHRRVDSLSGGERQRVALARSLAPQPRLLLLDEPLAALDRSLRDRLADEIRSILKTLGITAIFVTHDHSEAFAVADKIAILHEGRLEQIGDPEEVYRSPRTLAAARFLGFRNLLAARCDITGTVHTALGSWQGISTPRETEDVGWLLIRPDGARLFSPEDSAAAVLILSGRVIRRQFQGKSYHLTAEIHEQPVYFDLPLEPCPPAAGEPVMLTLSPDNMKWLHAPPERNI